MICWCNVKRYTTVPVHHSALSGWLNRQRQVVMDYLIEENRVLKELFEGHRLRFTGEQRIRLAVKARVLGRRALDELRRR